MHERLPYAGKIAGVVFRVRLARKVEDRQGAAARERQLESVNERHLTGRRKVRRVEDPNHTFASRHAQTPSRAGIQSRCVEPPVPLTSPPHPLGVQ